MPTVQTRSKKAEATPKIARRSAAAAAPVAPVAPAVKPKAESKPKKRKAEAPPGPGAAIGLHEREMMVARAAYFRAEKRGFAPGNELQDWIEAEAEVLQLVGGA